MKRVEITKEYLGLAGMQVCAEKDVSDQEILNICNRLNPSGTSGGWQEVVRSVDKEYIKESMLPVNCEKHNNRIHFIVIC